MIYTQNENRIEGGLKMGNWGDKWGVETPD